MLVARSRVFGTEYDGRTIHVNDNDQEEGIETPNAQVCQVDFTRAPGVLRPPADVRVIDLPGPAVPRQRPDMSVPLDDIEGPDCQAYDSAEDLINNFVLRDLRSWCEIHGISRKGSKREVAERILKRVLADRPPDPTAKDYEG